MGELLYFKNCEERKKAEELLKKCWPEVSFVVMRLDMQNILEEERIHFGKWDIEFDKKRMIYNGTEIVITDMQWEILQGKELIEKEQILIIGSDLKLSDGSGMELLEYLREKTYKIPFLFFTCYDKKYYEKEALEKGAKICMNKLQFDLVKETLLEYAYKESNGEGATFHKILLVKKNSEITSIIQTELLKKGIYMIMVETIWEAENKLLECQDIELILCDLFLQDGIAMDFFYSMKKLAGIYQNTKEPIFRELPFFISLIIKIYL